MKQMRGCTQPLTLGLALVLTWGVGAHSALNGVGGTHCVSTSQVGVRPPDTLISKGRVLCPSPPAPAGQRAIPERKPVPANWQRPQPRNTMGLSLSLVLPFWERQVLLSGSVFSPLPTHFSYRVCNEVETVHSALTLGGQP